MVCENRFIFYIFATLCKLQPRAWDTQCQKCTQYTFPCCSKLSSRSLLQKGMEGHLLILHYKNKYIRLHAQSLSHASFVATPGLQPARLLCPWNSPGKNTEVGSRSLLQEIFPTQGSNSGILHCRWILHPLSHQGRPQIHIFPEKEE